jgi:hypothetical protein
MNFIALGVIAEIDDLYAGALLNFELKKCVENEDDLPRFTNKFEDVEKTLSNF